MSYIIKVVCSICTMKIGEKPGGQVPNTESHTYCDDCAEDYMREQRNIMAKTVVEGDPLITLKNRFKTLTDYVYGPQRTTVDGAVEILKRESQGKYLFLLERELYDLYEYMDAEIIEVAINDVLTDRRRRATYA